MATEKTDNTAEATATADTIADLQAKLAALTAEREAESRGDLGEGVTVDATGTVSRKFA